MGHQDFINNLLVLLSDVCWHFCSRRRRIFGCFCWAPPPTSAGGCYAARVGLWRDLTALMSSFLSFFDTLTLMLQISESLNLSAWPMTISACSVVVRGSAPHLLIFCKNFTTNCFDLFEVSRKYKIKVCCD